MKAMALLTTEGLGINFGGLRAVSDVNIEIGYNELIGLIGPNGAGKTTCFNLLTGVYVPTDGKITFGDKNLSLVGKSVHQINNSGIARTFQNIRLFKEMSVIDNVKVAFHSSMKYSPISGILRLPSYQKEEKEIERKAMELLSVFSLENLANEKSCNLPYGKQRKLEISRALATNPQLLLLDEPAAGMNPSETAELMDTIDLIRNKFKISILLIEHDMNLVMGICERIYVLDYGMVIAHGVPDEIKNNPKVISAYLGE